jgi:two-component system OmpR family response regulator
LVEDSERPRQLLEESMREADYALDIVVTTPEFRAVVRSVDFDRVVVNLGIPDGDGLRLIRELRASPATRDRWRISGGSGAIERITRPPP